MDSKSVCPSIFQSLHVRLQMEGRVRELALFNLGIDGKLRGCDLVALKCATCAMAIR